MPYKPSRTRTSVFASRRFARDQRRRVSNHSVSLLRLRKDIQDQAKCSKTQSTAPGVEYIPFYIPLNLRPCCFCKQSQIVIGRKRWCRGLLLGVWGAATTLRKLKKTVLNEYILFHVSVILW